MKTAYDKMRDELRETLENCLEQSKSLMNRNVYGFDELPKNYAVEIYKAISDVLDIV